jgi:hypothetical protein
MSDTLPFKLTHYPYIAICVTTTQCICEKKIYKRALKCLHSGTKKIASAKLNQSRVKLYMAVKTVLSMLSKLSKIASIAPLSYGKAALCFALGGDLSTFKKLTNLGELPIGQQSIYLAIID